MVNLNENGDSPTTCSGESVYAIVGELLPAIVRGRSRKTSDEPGVGSLGKPGFLRYKVGLRRFTK
jgi:hypothetical protein